jgi:hypothetical protein
VESFFFTLKYEFDLDRDAEDLFSSQQLQSWLGFWIDGCYNRELRYSTIDHISPINCEQQCVTTRTLSALKP